MALIIHALAFVILLLFFPMISVQAGAPDFSVNTCGGKPIEGCPCGKLPVCIISDHPYGLYSQMKNIEHSQWKGFGEGESDFAEAMYIEAKVTEALSSALPCIEPIPLNSYQAAAQVVHDEAEKRFGQQIGEAKAAGDQKKLEELYAQVDALYQEYGLGDVPWRDENLNMMQSAFRIMGCVTTVELRGTSEGGSFIVTATVSSIAAQLSEQELSATSNSPDGGVGELAKKAAKELKRAQEQLFCCCEEAKETCVTTKFDLANPKSECTTVRSCCGQEVNREGPKPVSGIRAGAKVTYEPKCCSDLARSRAGELLPGQGAESASEDRNLFDQIWCPGTWRLRNTDFDCDGIPNVKDPSPWPPGESPEELKAKSSSGKTP